MSWLKEFRVINGYKRKQMAQMLGISESLYIKVEMGVRNPSANFMIRFLTVFPETDANIFFKAKVHDMQFDDI